MNHTDKSLCLYESYVFVEETDIIKVLCGKIKETRDKGGEAELEKRS